MKNFDWLQAFAMEQQEQPEPGVSADAAPQDEQERAEAFRALIQGPYKKDYDRQVQMIVRERLKNCTRSEQVLKSLGPALEKTFGVDASQLTPEQAERLANTYADAILRLSYTYLKNTHDAQDICQTVFVKLWGWSPMEQPGSTVTWANRRPWL